MCGTPRLTVQCDVMDDEKANLRTIRKLARMEAGIIEIRNPRSYLWTIAERLSYLHKKDQELPATVARPTFQESERDALFWALAHYAVLSGYDVRSVLAEQDKAQRLKLERFDQIFRAVQYLCELASLGRRSLPMAAPPLDGHPDCKRQ